MNFYVRSLPGSKGELGRKANIYDSAQQESNILHRISIKKASIILFVTC